MANITESASAGQHIAGRHPFWLIGWGALWMASLGNAALWRELAQLRLLDGTGGLALGAGIGVLLVALLFALLGLLAWRATLKPALTLLLVASALATHFMFTYHVVLDTTMVTNVLQTNPGEARDLMGLRRHDGSFHVVPAMCAWVGGSCVQRSHHCPPHGMR